MNKKYYKMDVYIKGTILVKQEDYDSQEEAIECVEMSDDIQDIAYKIWENKDDICFIQVDKKSVKETEY